MSLHSKEAVGVRYTGWAALGRDPQEDTVEYNCPYCGERGMKTARRTHDQYHFTDGFLQDLQGEMAACRACRHSLRSAPVVMLHDHDERPFGMLAPPGGPAPEQARERLRRGLEISDCHDHVVEMGEHARREGYP